MDFWHTIKTPIFALAPMEDVTDTVFRELLLSVSSGDRLHLLFSEFTSIDGMLHKQGREVVSQRLNVSAGERKLLREKNVKLVAQLWGSDPERFFRAAEIIRNDYSFDGIDINMGCPVKKIVKQGACSALILQPMLATEIIHAVKEGSGMPVSVKTRIGYDSIETISWIGNLLSADPSAITIHGRTRKMQSEGLADWNEIFKAVELRNSLKKQTRIIGNGDVMSIPDAMEKINQSRVDGVMIGRGIFSNPWLFSNQPGDKSREEKIEILLKHSELFTNHWGEIKNFAILKRFFKIYLSGFQGAANLRANLMKAGSMEDVNSYLKNQS